MRTFRTLTATDCARYPGLHKEVWNGVQIFVLQPFSCHQLLRWVMCYTQRHYQNKIDKIYPLSYETNLLLLIILKWVKHNQRLPFSASLNTGFNIKSTDIRTYGSSFYDILAILGLKHKIRKRVVVKNQSISPLAHSYLVIWASTYERRCNIRK